MKHEELTYALSKQIPELEHTCTFQTHYGDLTLRGKDAARVAKLLKQMLEKKLQRMEREISSSIAS